MRLSDDRKRGVDYSPTFAIAAYEVDEVDGEYIGHHCGIFRDEINAESWLKTGKPQPQPLKIKGRSSSHLREAGSSA